MNLSEWRASRATEFDLPSGLHVKLRRVKLADLAAQGDIPMPLLDEIASEEVNAKPDNETRKHRKKIMEIVAKCALLDPLCADAADETHISIDELTFDDLSEIYAQANSEAAQLAPFFQDEPKRADLG